MCNLVAGEGRCSKKRRVKQKPDCLKSMYCKIAHLEVNISYNIIVLIANPGVSYQGIWFVQVAGFIYRARVCTTPPFNCNILYISSANEIWWNLAGAEELRLNRRSWKI